MLKKGLILWVLVTALTPWPSEARVVRFVVEQKRALAEGMSVITLTGLTAGVVVALGARDISNCCYSASRAPISRRMVRLLRSS